MSKFAKLIELENEGQVLVTLSANDAPEDENDNFEMIIRTDVRSFEAKVKLGYPTEEKAKSKMDMFSKEDAISFRKAMEDLFN